MQYNPQCPQSQLENPTPWQDEPLQVNAHRLDGMLVFNRQREFFIAMTKFQIECQKFVVVSI